MPQPFTPTELLAFLGQANTFEEFGERLREAFDAPEDQEEPTPDE